MLSQGTELSRAFSTADASVMLPSTLGPPSRAATSIARRSFANTWLRLASAAPFLRLIVLHLEWPDIAKNLAHGRSAGRFEHCPVQSRVAGDLGVKGRRQQLPLTDHHGHPGMLGEDLDALT